MFKLFTQPIYMKFHVWSTVMKYTSLKKASVWYLLMKAIQSWWGASLWGCLGIFFGSRLSFCCMVVQSGLLSGSFCSEVSVVHHSVAKSSPVDSWPTSALVMFSLIPLCSSWIGEFSFTNLRNLKFGILLCLLRFNSGHGITCLSP